MKRSFTKTLALLIALALALPTFALAEAGSAPEDVYIVGAAGDGEVFAAGVEPEALPGGDDLSGGGLSWMTRAGRSSRRGQMSRARTKRGQRTLGRWWMILKSLPL